MKILIILCSFDFNIKWSDNIKILNDTIQSNENEVHYCGISSKNDFYNYENIIEFKYKIINTKPQLSKICDFITEYKSTLNYDWYIKTRPEIQILDGIQFGLLSKTAINSRARIYNGPSKIKYGMSVNGEGFKKIDACFFSEQEHSIVLDDMFYIFSHNIVEKNAFEKIQSVNVENEWIHARIFNSRNIPIKIVGINLNFLKYGNCFSGNINMLDGVITCT